MGLRDWLRERRAGAAAVVELLQRADALADADGGLRRGDAVTVLAAVDHSDGAAAAVLRGLGIDRAAVETAVRVAMAGVPGGHAEDGPDNRSLLRRTSDRSGTHLGGARFSSALVLAAAAETEGGAVATLVDRLGVDRGHLHDTAVSVARGRATG